MMPGRHARRDEPRFIRELAFFALKVAFWGGVVIAAVWLFTQIPSLGAGQPESGETISATTTTVEVPPSTTEVQPPTTLQRTLEPSELTILIMNSTTVSGLAGRVKERIEDLGYITLPPDNYPTLLSDSVLWFVPGFESEAEELARVLPEMAVVENPNPEPLADLVVILGDSFEE